MRYLTNVLANTHQKANFSCGKVMLDTYIQKQAKQEVKSKVSACFVLSDDEKEIKGYYTLSNGSIPRSQLPEAIANKLPKYQNLPITLLGRLAVGKKFHGQKLGVQILMDALKRSFDAASITASMGIIVDPIDKAAKEFYLKYGFIQLPDSVRMFILMQTIEKLIR